MCFARIRNNLPTQDLHWCLSADTSWGLQGMELGAALPCSPGKPAAQSPLAAGRKTENFNSNQNVPSTQAVCICLFSFSALPGQTSHWAAELSFPQATPEHRVFHIASNGNSDQSLGFQCPGRNLPLPWSCLCKSLAVHTSGTLKSMAALAWADSASSGTFCSVGGSPHFSPYCIDPLRISTTKNGGDSDLWSVIKAGCTTPRTQVHNHLPEGRSCSAQCVQSDGWRVMDLDSAVLKMAHFKTQLLK